MPSDDEWTTLTDYLGEGVGTKMKSALGWSSYSGKKECPQCSNWSPSKKAGTQCDRCNDKGEIESELSGNGTNESGFSGLPGGYRDDGGDYGSVGSFGGWWSSTQKFWSKLAWTRNLSYNGSVVYRYNKNKEGGLSVRCLRD